MQTSSTARAAARQARGFALPAQRLRALTACGVAAGAPPRAGAGSAATRSTSPAICGRGLALARGLAGRRAGARAGGGRRHPSARCRSTATGRSRDWRTARQLGPAIREHRHRVGPCARARPAAIGADAASAARDPVSSPPSTTAGQASRHRRYARARDRRLRLRGRGADGRPAGLAPDRLRVVRRWIDPTSSIPSGCAATASWPWPSAGELGDGPKVVLVPPLHSGGPRPSACCSRRWRGCRGPTAWRCSLGAIRTRALWPRAAGDRRAGPGCGERVRFGGDVDDLPAALSLADVVVVPATRPDPSGIMAAAAQAMGRR